MEAYSPFLIVNNLIKPKRYDFNCRQWSDEGRMDSLK